MKTAEQLSLLNELLSHKKIQKNLSVPQLVEHILYLEEAKLTETGAICAETGDYTGRSPKDRFIVEDDVSAGKVDWGAVNQAIDEDTFENLYYIVIKHLSKNKEIFLFEGFAGADAKYRLPVQVITEYAWHNLFARQMLIRPTQEELSNHEAEFTVISAPNFKANPEVDGTASEVFVFISLKRKIILIGGTEYAGEIKK